MSAPPLRSLLFSRLSSPLRQKSGGARERVVCAGAEAVDYFLRKKIHCSAQFPSRVYYRKSRRERERERGRDVNVVGSPVHSIYQRVIPLTRQCCVEIIFLCSAQEEAERDDDPRGDRSHRKAHGDGEYLLLTSWYIYIIAAAVRRCGIFASNGIVFLVRFPRGWSIFID